MKSKLNVIVVVLCLLSTASIAQYKYKSNGDDNGEYRSYLKFGTQVPFQHSIIYDHRITPLFSINGGIGLITAPYTGAIFSGLENKGLISANDRAILDRSYQMGVSYQLGANFHFQKNYVRAYGQLARLNGDLSLTDLANLYLNTNIPPIGRFLSPIDIRTNVPMVGLLFGRRFSIGEHSEIHAEASVMKTLGHNTSYKTGTLLDNFEIVNDVLFTGLDNDLDSYFNNHGWFPSLNVYYVYKF